MDTHTQEHRIEKGKWGRLSLLGIAELFAMCTWFSASAVVPALTAAWGLGDTGRAWLTMSVQIGFVVGSLGSALLNLPDRIPAHRLFTLSALLAAISTALIPGLAGGLSLALLLRFLTGMFLAGVYPVGMKIMATWTQSDRGLGIGLLVGALTLGSASPHLLAALGGMADWRRVLFWAAGLALTGALLSLFIIEGPYRTAAPRFDWKYAIEVFRNRALRLANLGYLGHMWELYAMWAWIAVYLAATAPLSGLPENRVSLLAFITIGVGGLSSLVAGKLADRFGRTRVTIVSMLVSGACALLVGLFAANAVMLVIVCLLWGFTIVADSAQFSAAISELCRPEYTGTALTLQTSLGFLLTLLPIRMVPMAADAVGWHWAFGFLALGPLVGIISMRMLRSSSEAVRMAGGRR